MDARFIKACTRYRDLPPPSLPELAVAGRSNCGKSSLINAMTGVSKLARTSSTPGRTRQIIFFSLSLVEVGPIYLVDLPGYGYAKVSRTTRQSWAPLINQYIEQRTTLKALLLLLDIRRPPAGEERDLLSWIEDRGIHPLIVLTKADKLNKSQRFSAAQSAKHELGLDRRPLTFSIHQRQTITELRDQVHGLWGG